MERMPMKKFAALVRRVMETLPPEIAEHLDNVVVEVAEEPDEAFLRRAGFTAEEIAAGDSLLGYFDPLELPSAWGGDVVDTETMLHRLWIFRNPHEDDFPNPKRLRIEIRKTVIHELAHHFGFTDHDLERFDDNPNPFRRKRRSPPTTPDEPTPDEPKTGGRS